MRLTGAASGLISVLGYMPDMFIFNIMADGLTTCPVLRDTVTSSFLQPCSWYLATGVGFYIYRYGKSLKTGND